MKSITLLMTSIVAIVLVTGCSSSKGAGGSAGSPTVPSPTPAPTAAPESEPLLNRLKWTTATEVDNFGFDIYRSTSEDGPFERITSTPIPGSGTVDEPRSYQFEDEDIDPTQDYFYYVESISIDGIREQFSPVIKAKAKQPAGE